MTQASDINSHREVLRVCCAYEYFLPMLRVMWSKSWENQRFYHASHQRADMTVTEGHVIKLLAETHTRAHRVSVFSDRIQPTPQMMDVLQQCNVSYLKIKTCYTPQYNVCFIDYIWRSPESRPEINV